MHLQLIALTVAALVTDARAQPAPDYGSLVSAVRLERSAFGRLSELDGKYKFRASETTIEPAGYIGEHQHVGPGIRYVLAGELTFVEDGRTFVFRAGDYFYETGSTTHRGENRGPANVVLLQFELVPAAWSSTGTAVAPPAR